MPRLNQKYQYIDPNWFPSRNPYLSQLCGPTAGAMALGGVLSETQQLPSGWIGSYFLNQSGARQIENMASLMNTTVGGGTFLEPGISGADRLISAVIGSFGGIGNTRTTGGSASSLLSSGSRTQATTSVMASASVPASGRSPASSPLISLPTVSVDSSVDYPPSQFIDRFHGRDPHHPGKKVSTTLLYGHYYKVSASFFGFTTSWFQRRGGHFVTINGHIGNTFLIFDPWGAAPTSPYGIARLQQMSNLLTGFSGNGWTSYPFFTSTALYNDESYTQIIESELGIWVD